MNSLKVVSMRALKIDFVTLMVWIREVFVTLEPLPSKYLNNVLGLCH